MRRPRALLHEVMIVVLLVLAVGSAAAQSEVTRLRMDKVTLYPCTEPERNLDEAQTKLAGNAEFAKKPKPVGRAEFSTRWPILAGPSKAGRLTVKVGDELYCVRAYAVQTDEPINAGADCGTMVATAQPRSGATRGLGNEHCRK
jgi:hypothetical protein